MKKLIMKSLALLIALMTVFSLAACGPKTKQTGIIYEVPEIEGTITFSYAADTESKQNAANAYIDAFTAKYPKAQVDRDYGYRTGDAEKRIAAGNIGDVFYFAEAQAYNYAVTHEALMPLQYYMEVLDINIDDIYSGIYAAGMINGQYYYVARDFNQMIMIYDKTLVESKQLTNLVKPGWTWDDFMYVCDQLTDETHYGAQIQLSYDPVFIPLLEANIGRNKWFDTAARKVDLTSTGTLDAIEELFSKYTDQGGTIDLQLGAYNDYYSSRTPVFKQNVYVAVEGIGKDLENNAQHDWDMIHLPLAQNPAFGCGSSGVGVYNGTSNPDAAAAFALFFYTPEGQTAFNGQDGGSVPVLASLKDADFWRHAEDDWSDKYWDANIYMADDYAVIGQFECILPPEVAAALQDNLHAQLAQVAAGIQTLSDAMSYLETLANGAWEDIA